jgi:hypothetical protein
MEQEQIKNLEEKLHKLIALLTDQNLWNFLSDRERQTVSEVLNQN